MRLATSSWRMLMECHDVIEYLLDMDNGEELPRDVADHIGGCSWCRADVARLTQTLDGIRRVAMVAENPALTERIMFSVRDAAETADQPTRLRSWIVIGALILVGVTGLRFSEVMTWLRQSTGPAIDVAMSVILGVFLTGYICILVGSNMDRVLRMFRQR